MSLLPLLVLGAGALALLFAAYLAYKVISEDADPIFPADVVFPMKLIVLEATSKTELVANVMPLPSIPASDAVNISFEALLNSFILIKFFSSKNFSFFKLFSKNCLISSVWGMANWREIEDTTTKV